MKRKGLVLSISLVLLLVLTSVRAQAQCCYNPLVLPFAVAGAIVGTAAAIVMPGPFIQLPSLLRSGARLLRLRSKAFLLQAGLGRSS
jgi:hypothetical protein